MKIHMTHMITGVLVGVLSLTMAGCSHYYRVTEPASGKTYYTTHIDERSGAAKFKDERTGSYVILHSAEVSELSEDEYGTQVKEARPSLMSPPIATRRSAETEP
jgi:hypothetical protein